MKKGCAGGICTCHRSWEGEPFERFGVEIANPGHPKYLMK